MTKVHHEIFPTSKAKRLDTPLRRLLQNPYKILRPFITPGMRVLDYGCGSGYFTLPMAMMTEESGEVTGVDLQQGMLDIAADKIRQAKIPNVRLICSDGNRFMRDDPFDFVLAFYVVHELPDSNSFFAGMHKVMKPGGRLLIVEPVFEVSGEEFTRNLQVARDEGFVQIKRWRTLMSHYGIIQKM